MSYFALKRSQSILSLEGTGIGKGNCEDRGRHAVEEELISQSEDDMYSSACDYAGGNGLLDAVFVIK
jgi:hypothetical protein